MGSGTASQATPSVAPVPRESVETDIRAPAPQPEVEQDRLVVVQQGDVLAINIHIDSEEVDLAALYHGHKRALDTELRAIVREYLGRSTDIVLCIRPGSLVARIVGRFWESVSVRLSEMARRIKSVVMDFLTLVEAGARIMVLFGFQVIEPVRAFRDTVEDMFDRIIDWFSLRPRDAFAEAREAFAEAIERMLRRNRGGYGDGDFFFV